MATQPRKGGVSLPGRRPGKNQQPQTNKGKSKSKNNNIIAQMSNYQIVSKGKQATCDAVYVTKKLLKSTGKAAWIAGTTFLVLVVPLIIEMDREQQLNDLELQQQSLLGAPTILPTK